MGAFLIAGTQSGSGKTTVTLGVMAALKARGLSVQPFKCGPDFIDPTLHQMVTGKISRNLDIWMCGDEFVQETFLKHSKGADVSVIEGVMGLFDGGVSSSASLARCLGLPVVLVVDARSMAETAAAVIKGFEVFEPGLVQGVILNRVGSQRHIELLEGAIKKYCNPDLLLGYLPRDLDFEIPARHLGLFMGHDAPLDKEAIGRLSSTVTKHINIEQLMNLRNSDSLKVLKTNGACKLNNDYGHGQDHEINIAIARDDAFCFYYEDNIDLLREMGARITEFSPLSDKTLPQDIDAVYLGGGYPELHARTLSENHGMLKAVRQWSLSGGVIYAECGGFMYLTQGIEDNSGGFHPMAGVYPVRARMNSRLSALGYREIQPLSGPFASIGDDDHKDCSGQGLRGHEFHYSIIEDMPPDIQRAFRLADGGYEGYLIKNTLGSYVHLHFGKTKRAIKRFIEFSKEARRGL